MDWPAIADAIQTGNSILLLALILFGGGTGERALWVYGWIYRQMRAELKAERAEKERWQRAFIRMAPRADQAGNKTGEAINLASDLLHSANTKRGQDVDVDE